MVLSFFVCLSVRNQENQNSNVNGPRNNRSQLNSGGSDQSGIHDRYPFDINEMLSNI